MSNVRVFIPPGEQLFSLYADGNLIKKEGNEDEGYNLEFTPQMIALFYHSKNHRRCYVTVDPLLVSHWGFQQYSLHGVDEKRVVIAVLLGRSFDRFKRSLSLLKKMTANCYNLPPLFWIRFAYLAQKGRNSVSNIERLLTYFGDENGL